MTDRTKLRAVFLSAATAVVLAAVVLVCAGCGKGKDKLPPGASESTIVCGSLYGQGTVLSADETSTLIATAAHVLEDHTRDSREKILVSFADGTTLFGEMIYMDQERDIAFLKTEGVRSEKVGAARMEKMYPQSAAPVHCYVQGEEHAGSFLSPDTEIRGLGSSLYYFLCDVRDGMSGCGVYDERDGYIGMLIGGDGEGRAGALPASEIEEHLRSAGVTGP
ncbi:MAG: trypsin-like peptidase domain-containing protein [Lachnospiraceae bacterium]|nr:trypsin-like peptidase domain-containing protein [Lachnospiraceae bacterium]